MWQRSFVALGTPVLVSCADEHAAGQLDLLTASYPAAMAAPGLRFELVHVEAWQVRRQGVTIHAGSVLTDALGALELSLYDSLVAASGPGWLLHASAVGRAGSALVLAGSSGAGKTTMAFELLGRAGTGYVGDEYVRIDADGDAHGLLRPLILKKMPALKSMPARPGFRCAALPAPSGSDAAEVALVVPPTLLLGNPPHVAALVHLRHGPLATPGLRRLHAGEALATFWPCTWRPDKQALQLAGELVAKLPAYSLVARSVEESLGYLDRLWACCEQHSRATQ